jgi:Response regulators consisting of a CheY-like receiver domain and a winged-helix DNA-binding domain
MALILLVEDNYHIMKMNADELIDCGYEVQCAETIKQARKLMFLRVPDLMILDVLLPDGNGIDFCREIRRTTDFPIIFLSALNESKDIVNGLHSGAEDYLAKPYSLDVLVARVEVQLRMHAQLHSWIELGPLKVDPASMICWLNDEDLLLTKKEFAVLMVLIKGRNRVISMSEIYASAWGQEMADNNQALRTVISRLKKKIPADQSGIHISFVRNAGYMLERIEL